MYDRYTKVILTVIAVALSAIALKMPTGGRAMALDGECGSFSNPCYVDTPNSYGLKVYIKD